MTPPFIDLAEIGMVLLQRARASDDARKQVPARSTSQD
jgi:hypothetical protein